MAGGQRPRESDHHRPGRRAGGGIGAALEALTVWQAYQVYSDWVTHTIRLYAGQNVIESSFTVGPIPFRDGLGREVVSVWQTGASSWVCWQ